MSQAALLTAVAAHLRRSLGYQESECGVRPTGQPPYMAGQRYVAVHGAGLRQADDHPHSRDDSHDVTVTLTLKAGGVPDDRAGAALIAEAEAGVYAEAEAVAAKLHGIYEPLRLANLALNAPELTGISPASADTNGFIEPLRLRSISEPQEKGPAWFRTAEKATAGAPAGYAVVIRLGGARRVQRLEEQE